MVRRILAVLLTLALTPGLWWQSAPPRHDRAPRLTLAAVPLPDDCCRIPGIRIERAWHITSNHEDFGGYSALIADGSGSLLAIGDGGQSLRFRKPMLAGGASAAFGAAVPIVSRHKGNRDVEAATRDPVSGRLWLALEGKGMILRRDAALADQGGVIVPAMRAWPGNAGPEAMVRLADGRFVILGETYSGSLERQRHPGLLFGGDPVEGATAQPFTFVGAAGFRPTDMAQLPDGRVLIVMRRLVWPFPIRFDARLMLADPAGLRPGGEWRAIDLGALPDGVPMDNYEGLALEPQRDGTVRGWLISDDNAAALQRTLVLELRIAPAALPRR